ncbi:Eco57I restriction-modification methylase domain-containing protein [Aquisphaera insulae]|uniref:Eco57I restriction-modification methylase domain-containing protein n=1 Tax=Aquisphaera insulae TaxID=2712864 RepID=UPI0013EAA35E|nr:DNA methyltransferase [Aquisphaera insulae]
MSLNVERARDCLRSFDFSRLFIEELGWSRPARRADVAIEAKDARATGRHAAELSGAVVIEVTAHDGAIPDAKARAAIHKEIAKQHHENLLIFVDRERTQSLWYWVKRQDGKSLVRDHLYLKGQPGDLFLGKLNQMVFDLADFDAEGNVSIVDVARRLQSALDVEKVTKKFFRDFQEQHVAFLELIRGIDDERNRRWYASVLLNRLMFITFLQKKTPGFLDGGNRSYLRDKLVESKARGADRYYSEFLQALFFEGFARPEAKRSAAARKLLGDIRYLNGGLFLRHRIEIEHPGIAVPDSAFENLFDLFDGYTWHLDDTPGGKDDEINPDVLGYIFEKYINQKAFGAYYTRPQITEYLCEQTIHRLILDAVNTPDELRAHPTRGAKIRAYDSLGDLLLDLDAPLCRRLLNEVLPRLSLLDPACGSGAFLVAAMKTLINVYAAVIGRIKFLKDKELTAWLAGIEAKHPSLSYYIKKRIITDNLFGVDVMEEATEIARLRLFLALVASARTVDDLEPLPNIDFNILAGNSLIGLLRVDETAFESRLYQGNLFRPKYRQVLDEKNRLIDSFRHATEYAEDLTSLRDTIAEKKREAYDSLNEMLLDEFQELGIKYEEATWDTGRNKEGKSIKRALAPADIEALHPFHWGFEFDDVLNRRGGFDAIITNPPWEVFQTDEKEFCQQYEDSIRKKKIRIEEWTEKFGGFMKEPEFRKAWLAYASRFAHLSSYFKNAEQYRSQVSTQNGRTHATKINLYKLFVEQCFNLLREGGRCGMITPASIYRDLGAKQLRSLLFDRSDLNPVFGLSNERFLFEGVHHSFGICILAFRKGGNTDSISASFRINPREAVAAEELGDFLHDPSVRIQIPTSLVRRLSPDSLSIMEFKCDLDVQIAEKLTRFPLLGQPSTETWNVRFAQEFNMTSDHNLFKTSSGKGRLPLYEGKMIQQFQHRIVEPKYWLDEREARASLLGRNPDEGQVLPYQGFRLAFRDVARNTDARTAIMTMLPPRVFCSHPLPYVIVTSMDPHVSPHVIALLFCSLVNSLVVDFCLRQRVTTHLTFFLMNQLPIPRITNREPLFRPIVDRAARLLCTTSEFDDLARDAGLKSHRSGETDPDHRQRLRSELDGLVARLYGLTWDEFAHVLDSFPLVSESAKLAAKNAYRDVERGLIR